MSKEDAFPHFVEYSPKEAGHFKAFIQRAKKASPNGAGWLDMPSTKTGN